MSHASFHKRIYIVLVSNFMVKYNWAVKFGYFFVLTIGGPCPLRSSADDSTFRSIEVRVL